MWEQLKDIGSLVGLLTGFFYFYDRFAKGRPIGSFAVVPQGKRPSARIRIANAGQYDVGIIAITVHPKIYALAEKDEIEETIRASLGKVPAFMLKPGEQRDLRLIALIKDGLALELKQQNVTFLLWWRRGNATWLPQIPVPIFADTVTIRKFGLEQID